MTVVTALPVRCAARTVAGPADRKNTWARRKKPYAPSDIMSRLLLADVMAKSLSRFFYGLLLVAFCCSGCVVVPKTVSSEEDSRCRLTTRKVTLDVSDDGPNSVLKGALRVTTACKEAECLLIVPAALVAIPVGSVVVSGSIMVGGNTIHWLEAQGKCEDSVTRSAVNSFMATTKAAGGMVVESYQDLAAWLTKYFPQQEQMETKIGEPGQATESISERP